MRYSTWIIVVILVVVIVGVIYMAIPKGDQTEDSNELTDISIRLKWLHQAQFAGFYYASESGMYSERGLDVKLHPGGVDYPAIQMVTSGSDDFGVTGADQIILAREKGIPVVAVACVFRKSPFVLFSLKTSGIEAVEDFPGHTIGVKLGGNEELTYRAMMREAGLSPTDVDEIPVKFDISPLLSGEIDVWPGYSINEPIVAEEQGHPVNLIWPDQYGINLYADVMFTTEKMLRTNPSLVQNVVEATIQGWQAAFDNPDQAVVYVLRQSNQLAKGHERRMLDASRALVMPDEKPIGWMDMNVWEQMHKLLLNNGFIDAPVDLNQAFRVDFIPHEDK